MSGAAQIQLTGNLTAEPELRFTPSGLPVANFSVAVGERVKNGDEWVDGPTTFYRVTAWRGLAENVAASLRKGQRITVAGTIRAVEYEKDGEKRLSWEVTADEVGASLAFHEVEVKARIRAVASQPADAAPAGGGDPAYAPAATGTTDAAPF